MFGFMGLVCPWFQYQYWIKIGILQHQDRGLNFHVSPLGVAEAPRVALPPAFIVEADDLGVVF